MSQYPYPYGYGQYHGNSPQQPYGYQAPPTFPAPSYSQSFNSSAADTNRAVSQTSFDYNASHIPGLGIGGSPPAAPLYNAAPDSGAWSLPSFSSHVPGLPQPTQASSGYPLNGPPPTASLWGAARASDAKPPTPPRQHASISAPANRQPSPDNDVEEGELSEGQFEDLYEPRESTQPRGTTQKPPIPVLAALPSQPPSVVDTPEAGFYGNDEEEGEVIPKENTGGATIRERSGSYSPFLSPREIQTEDTTPQPVEENGHGATSPFLTTSQSVKLLAVSRSQLGTAQEDRTEPSVAVPGLQFASQPLAGISSNASQAKKKSLVPETSSDFLGSFASLQEAKKEAQKAILRLWPLGVKYQHYIDEGFDEAVIKSLFGDLHLDMPKKATEASRTMGQDSQPGLGVLSKSSPSSDVQQQPRTDTNEPASKPDRSSKGEERKDRIARLLAAKAAKAPAAPSTKPAESDRVQTQTPEQGVGATILPKTKAWGEKELLIQQKIAALQKSRDALAQKSATEKSKMGGANAGDGTTDSATATQPLQITPPNPDGMLSEQNLPSKAGSTHHNPAQLASIPGLSISSTAQPGQFTNQRKRPVAADFVDYSSTVGPLKRPFGQDRTETSLIIDISDGSDDEEMDMDMESPGDGHFASREDSFAQRGMSIRDFPPLTDTVQPQQFSSPAPISQTPPGGPLNLRRRETELDIKERAIQEMRRKIAEAEARRKAKKSSVGSQTPNQASRTPELKEDEAARPQLGQRVVSTGLSDGPSAQLLSEAPSSRLPKRATRFLSGQLERAERRGRIVSLDLPRIKETIEEKMSRLKQIREEEERLQSEINQKKAEEMLLTRELEQMDADPSESESQPNGPSSDSSSGLVSTAEGPPVNIQRDSASGTPSSLSGQGEGVSDVSMDEDQSSREPSQSPTPSRETSELRPGAMSDVAITDIGEGGSEVNSEALHGAPDEVRPLEVDSTDGHQDIGSSGSGEADGEKTAAVSFLVEGSLQLHASLDKKAESAELNVEEDAVNIDDTAPMELESPPHSPSPTDHSIDPVAADDDSLNEGQQSALLPEQISSVAQPREDVQEIEAGTTRQVKVGSAPTSERVFVPYESPLRYFHAYRFHSGYQDSVAGGLKSMTYSNKIDPKKPLCPFQIDGQPCPPNCEFQHFESIAARDEQILLELGKSDGYTGDQKTRFIQGLRELLQNFRVNKVKDFDTIARGIIEFRSRFLGDSSKVLPLEGVTL